MAVFAASYFVAGPGDQDRGKLSTLIIIIAWGSMVFGLFLSRWAR